jgi:hypothetical protein
MSHLRRISVAAVMALGLTAGPAVLNAVPAWADLPCAWGDTSVSP